MKKALVALFAITAFAGTAFAADVINLPASMGKVSFPHAKHQKMLKDCKICHGAKGPGKIAELGKEWAHKTCRGCHEAGFKGEHGPTKCGGCHKK